MRSQPRVASYDCFKQDSDPSSWDPRKKVRKAHFYTLLPGRKVPHGPQSSEAGHM